MTTAAVSKINPQDLYLKQQNGENVEIIDVRTPAEYQSVHIPSARLAPLDVLDPHQVMGSRTADAHDSLYLVCQSGSRTSEAWKRFAAAGFDNVVCIDGGTQAWEQAGLPVERGREVIPLERQVRIGAGAMMLVGVALGLLVHPVGLILSAGVGAGLVYSGITGNCGMAKVLARMPWNQVQGA